MQVDAKRRAPWSEAHVVTRFAPSPTGRLHLGHAWSAFVAWRAAREAGGRFRLRLEDIDGGRCRPEHADGILDDLSWLGLDWDGPVQRQSARAPAYRCALDRLRALGVLYPCFCTRAEIRAEIDRLAQAPHGPEGPLYPGTCRHRSAREQRALIAAGRPHALRLDVGRALARTGPLVWHDRASGPRQARPERLGDVVLARKDAPTAYHLAVVVDDAWQDITLVTRGRDLLESTHVHRLLQALLGLPVPDYDHHRLVVDAAGRRLAKRADSQAIRTLRDRGWAPHQVLEAAEAALEPASVPDGAAADGA